jgi:molecular chaperone DnaJ
MYSDSEDLYKILGLNSDATKDQIIKAWRKLIRKHHPDLERDESKKKQAQDISSKINKAYNILSDPVKRKEYDQTRIDRNFDIFGEFRDFLDFGPKKIQRDIYVKLKVNIKQVLTSSNKNIKYSCLVTCRTCKGLGYTSFTTCPSCNGTGVKRFYNFTVTCNVCNGRGKIGSVGCNTCNTLGTIKKSENFDFKIPNNLRPGLSLRIPGKGNNIHNRSGDLIIEFEISDFENFKIINNKLYLFLKISLLECLSRSVIYIDVFGSSLKVILPKFLRSDTELQYPGYGLYNKFGSREKLYIKPIIDLPNLDSKNLDILKKIL